MTSQQKVLEKYPDAEVVHQRGLGRTIYAIRKAPMSGFAVGMGYSASKAWVDAAKNIVLNKPWYKL